MTVFSISLQSFQFIQKFTNYAGVRCMTNRSGMTHIEFLSSFYQSMSPSTHTQTSVLLFYHSVTDVSYLSSNVKMAHSA